MKNQVKFYVTDDEKKRLDTLAKLRFMTVPNYVRLNALGVQIRQVKEVFIVSDTSLENKVNLVLANEDKQLLNELIERSNGNHFIRLDTDFNERLLTLAKRLLVESEEL